MQIASGRHSWCVSSARNRKCVIEVTCDSCRCQMLPWLHVIYSIYYQVLLYVLSCTRCNPMFYLVPDVTSCSISYQLLPRILFHIRCYHIFNLVPDVTTYSISYQNMLHVLFCKICKMCTRCPILYQVLLHVPSHTRCYYMLYLV